MRRFEIYRTKKCKDTKVITEIIDDKHVRVKIPEKGIDVIYNPKSTKSKNGLKIGLHLKTQGNILNDNLFLSIGGNMDKDLLILKKDKLYGFIDYSGNIVINPIYKSAEDFSDGLAKVITIDDKVEFINTNGEVVLRTNVDWILNFKNGVAAVKKNNKYGFVDKSGKLVIEAKYDEICYDFNEYGFSIIKENNKYGTINLNGDYIIKPQFSMLSECSEGVLIATDLNDNDGVIDIWGNILIDFKYKDMGKCKDGMISFSANKKNGFINLKGEVVIEPKYNYVTNFSEGLAGFLDGNDNMGCINKIGDVVIKPKYQELDEFSEGLAVFTLNDLCGYIDKAGNEVIENLFLTADDFKNGVALITTQKDAEWGYIDKKGNWVFRPD